LAKPEMPTAPGGNIYLAGKPSFIQVWTPSGGFDNGSGSHSKFENVGAKELKI